MPAVYEKITSFQNHRLKEVRKLRERRERDKTGLFVIEYQRDLERAVQQGYVLEYGLVCSQLMQEADWEIAETLPADRLFEVKADMLAKVGYRQNPSGLLAVMRQKPLLDITDLLANVKTCLLLVNLQKPGNIGALLRTADAVGIEAVVLVDTVLDLYNPNIIRSSTGASFLGNVTYVSTDAVLPVLRQMGFEVIATVVDGEHSMFEATLTGNAAIALGTEDLGLPQRWIDEADQRIRIPMRGQIADSLNVSVSGAIILYEMLRQRESSDFET